MNNQLPNTLKKLLVENKLSARKLAKETGMSISSVSDFLNGREPSLKNLKLISNFFGVSLDYLVNGSDSSKIKNIDEFEFEDLFEGVVRIKISKLKDSAKKVKK